MTVHYCYDNFPPKPVAIDCPACDKSMPLNPVSSRYVDDWPLDWVCDDCEARIFCDERIPC